MMLKPVLELTFWSPIYREEPNLQFSICSKEVDDQICQKHHDGIVVKPQVYLKSGQPESQLFPVKMWVCPKIVSDPKYFKSSAMCFFVAQQFQWIIIILPILPTIKIIILPILPTFNGFSMDYHHHHYIKIAKDQLFPPDKKIDGRRKIAAKPIFMSSMVQCPIIAAATVTANWTGKNMKKCMALTGA